MMLSETERISSETISISAVMSAFGAFRQPLQKRKSKKDIGNSNFINFAVIILHKIKNSKIYGGK